MRTENTVDASIRRLRRERGMTQEELADLLGVSFQAVSKWETGASMPDLPQIPRLAAVFGVTTDEILAYSAREQEAKVEEICSEAYKYRFSDPKKSREILEAGLRNFPGNEIIENNILCVVDYKENPDEMILLASRLADRARLDDVRYDALRFLSYAYKVKGDMAAAEAALEQIPEIYFTKLGEVAYVLDGDKKFKAAMGQKWISFESLIDMMQALADVYESRGETEKARSELTRASDLLEAIRTDDKFDDYFVEQADKIRERIQKL